MRLHLFALALATALPIVATAQTSTTQAGAPSGPPPATLPATPLGRLAQRLLDVVEKGDSAAIAGFAKLGTPAVGRTIAVMRHADPDEGVRRRAELACARHGWGTGPLARS